MVDRCSHVIPREIVKRFFGPRKGSFDKSITDVQVSFDLTVCAASQEEDAQQLAFAK